ncbi:MFS transporter [Kitasatospora sp. CM 4170]|uniref:MFS transporter n=1 Tax=Kitasatospora aburaviensis TaxID=67265 RepID=A0ABW1ETR3_9ACTN|nr:MFS transporter [Kitasatospora sp. CM 4170]WNM43613.1 MFS transporter [Kitasatospora sp. CM 4170]
MGRLRALPGFAAFGVFWGTWGAVIPEVQQQARASDGELGVAVLMIGLGALCSMRAAGAAVDRYGRPAAALCVLAMAAAGSLPVFAHTETLLVLCLAVVGAASGAMDVAVNALAAEEERRSGPLMNLAHACFSAAVVAAAVAAGLALGHGVPAGALLGGASALIAAVAVGIQTLDRGAAPARSARGPRTVSVVDRRLLLLGVLCALAFLVENAWQSWSAVMLRSGFGLGPGAAALGPVLFAASAAAGRLAGHRLTSRLPRRTLLAGGACVAAAGTAAAALAASPAAMLAGVVVAGLGTSVCAPTILSLAGDRSAPELRASSISVVTTLGYGGFVLGPAAVGLTASATSLRTAFYGVGVVAAALAIAAVTVLPSDRAAHRRAGTAPGAPG